MIATPFSVITSLPFWGPLALLALVSPFLFGGLALFVRRWLALLSVASLSSSLYVLQGWYGGELREAGLDDRQVFWVAVAVTAVAGAFWARWRQRQALQTGVEEQLYMPRLAEVLSLLSGGLLAAGLTAFSAPVGRGWLAAAVTLLAGGIHACLLTWAGTSWLKSRAVLTTEGTMLVALAAIALVLALTSGSQAVPYGPRIVWTFEQTQRGAVISSPAVDQECLYVAAIRDNAFAPAGVVYCLDRETGKVRWSFDDGGNMQHMFSSPCLADGRLYVGEGMHANFRCKLYCLDASSGRKLWHFEAAGHIESSPCVANAKVYFGAGDDGLYCLDAVSGTKIWHFSGPYHIDTSPAVVGERVYAGSGVSRRNKTTEAFCLEAETGRVVWRHETRLPVWGSPCVAGEQVFFGLGTGRLERSADPGELPAGELLCLDAATGRPQWNLPVSEGVFGRAIADAERVYFGSRNGICYAVDRRTGNVLWQEDLGSPVIASPVLDGGRLYVIPSGGRFQCHEAATGRVLWSFDLAAHSQTRPRLYSSPCVLPDGDREVPGRRIYFGTELRHPLSSAAIVYCLQD